VEKIVLSKICQITYWKEQCFGLTAETLIDKAMELDHTDGAYGSNRKTQVHPVPLSHAQDAANPTRQGHSRRVHQE
jgi:hypothetical protein